MSADEIVDLYDEHGRVIGTAPRSRVRAENLRHGGTGVIVRDSAGRVFVHRRTVTKDVYPGLYDFCAGGVLQAGEHPDVAAAREVEEELGVSGVLLRRLGVAEYADAHTTYVAFLYDATYDGPLDLQPEEVESGEWLTLDELRARLSDPAWEFVPDSVALVGPHLDSLAGADGGSATEPGGRAARSH
ncbi:NUDIX hydrolase [Agilicoccus flavus]|uniref:NUDIX hydrolase n=1 Tax=Agilicoccus flavus TaxID=2775968 RepID=UPI001CF6282A|nr:NUDIX domain-containing protein [Agilicoccus flavus]